MQEQAASTDASRAVVMTVAQTDGVKQSAPLSLPGKAPVADEDEAPKPKAAKKPKVEIAEDDSEPEVRKDAAKPTAVPEKKSKLADIVSDWDDE